MQSRVWPKAIAILKLGGRHSKYDISLAVNCSMTHAQKTLREMHELGIIHISGWVPIYRTVIPEYSWGEGADVPKPQSTKASDAERMRKIRKDPEYRWKELMQKRAKRSRERKVVSDWWETRRVKHAG